jgi:hypothetical protein
MTTPVLTVFADDFSGASWNAEWSQQTATSKPSPTFSIDTGIGKITPTTNAGVGVNNLIYAASWRDTLLSGLEITATMGKSSYDASAVSHGWGILFYWDENINTPNGYMVHSVKGSGSSTSIRLSKIVSGSFTTLASIDSLSRITRTVTIRITPSGATNLIEFGVSSFSATGTGGWTSATDSTFSSGRVGVTLYGDGTMYSSESGTHEITSSDWISVDDFKVSRIGTSAGYVIPAVSQTNTPVSGVPVITGGTVLTSGSDTIGNPTTQATASISGTSNLGTQLYIAIIGSSGAVATAHTLTGCNLTWTVVQAATQGGANDKRITMFQAQGTLTTGALTFTGGAMTSRTWAVLEISGASDPTDYTLHPTLPVAYLPAINSSTSISSQTGSTISLTPAVALPSVSPYVLIIMAAISGVSGTLGAYTPGTFVTELVEVATTAPNTNLVVCYMSAPAATTITTTTASTPFGAVAAIIQPSICYHPFCGASSSWGGVY